MDNVKLSDHEIDPAEFGREVNLKSLESDRLVKSGAVEKRDFQNFLNDPLGGSIINLTPPNESVEIPPFIPTGVPGQMDTPRNTKPARIFAVRHELSKFWSLDDDALFLIGDDPIGLLQDQIAKCWVSQRHRLILATIKGLVAESEINHGGDLIYDKTITVNDLTEEGLIDLDAIIEAGSLFGESAIYQSALLGKRPVEPRWLVVHPVILNNLFRLGLIDVVNSPAHCFLLKDHPHYEVICDDEMTVVEVAPEVGGADALPAYTRYHSLILGQGSLVTDAGLPARPFEKCRNGLAREGRGQTSVISRVDWVLHPKGYRCNLTSTPTIAQLESASSWTRVDEADNIPFSVLITCG